MGPTSKKRRERKKGIWEREGREEGIGVAHPLFLA